MGLWETFGKDFQNENPIPNIPTIPKMPENSNSRYSRDFRYREPNRKNTIPEFTGTAKFRDCRYYRDKVSFCENVHATEDDAAWREWLDACSRYPGGCFSCASAVLDRVYFCRAANMAIFGADGVEVEMMHADGAETSPMAGNPSIEGKARRGVSRELLWRA